jgi:acyl carrier protein
MVERIDLERAVEDVYGRPLEATDDVFSLGGSSLEVVDVVSRFEAVLGFPVDVERLIMAETISELIKELVHDASEPLKE